MKVVLIADSHILTSKEAIEFSNFLRLLYEKHKFDTLILLGDIFDVWFEFKNVIIDRFFPALYELKRLKEDNVRIIYILGNHDWWSYGFFEEYLSIEVYKSDYKIVKLNDSINRILISHGDKVYKSKKYKILLSIMTNPILEFLYRYFPPFLGIFLAERFSKSSRKLGKDYCPEYTKKVNDKFMELLKRHNVNYGFLGHLHNFFILKSKDNKGNNFLLYNLPAWYKNKEYILIDDNEIFLKKGDKT